MFSSVPSPHMQAVRRHHAHLGLLVHATGQLASHLRAGLRSLGQAWLAHRRRTAARREFEQLDAAGLRDLAMCASEFDSCWAELNGSAPATRRRTPDALARRTP